MERHAPRAHGNARSRMVATIVGVTSETDQVNDAWGYSVMVDLLMPWSAHREDLAVECAPIGSETGSESKEGPNVHVDHQNTLC